MNSDCTSKSKTNKDNSLTKVATADGVTHSIPRDLINTRQFESILSTGSPIPLDSHTFKIIIELVIAARSKKPELFQKILHNCPRNAIEKIIEGIINLGYKVDLTKGLEFIKLCCSKFAYPHFDVLVESIDIPRFCPTDATLSLSCEGKTFTINKHLAFLSNTIKHLAQECNTNEAIPLSSPDSITLTTIISLLKNLAGPENERLKRGEITLDFGVVPMTRLLCALNYLDIPWLLQYVIIRLACYIDTEKNYAKLAELAQAFAPKEQSKSLIPQDITNLIRSMVKSIYKSTLIHTNPHKEAILSAPRKIYAISPDGSHALCVSESNGFFVWNFASSTSKPLNIVLPIDRQDLQYHTIPAVFSKDNHYLFIGAKACASLFDTSQPKQLRPCKIFIQSIEDPLNAPFVRTAAFTPDNKHLLLILSSNKLDIFDVTHKDHALKPKKTVQIDTFGRLLPSTNAIIASCTNEETVLVCVPPLSDDLPIYINAIVCCTYDTNQTTMYKKLTKAKAGVSNGFVTKAGNYVVTAEPYGRLCLYDLQQEGHVLSPIKEFHLNSFFDDPSVSQLSVSPDNTYALIGMHSKSLLADAIFLLHLQQQNVVHFIPAEALSINKGLAGSYYFQASFSEDQKSVLITDENKIIKIDIFGKTDNLSLPLLILKIKLLQDQGNDSILTHSYFKKIQKK